jgi:hypothetical protein
VSDLRKSSKVMLTLCDAMAGCCPPQPFPNGLTVAETWKILRPNTAGRLHSAGLAPAILRPREALWLHLNRSVSRRGECSIFPVAILCSIYNAYYNFCRVHQTLRVTPAMEAGLTDHIWSLEELVSLLECNKSTKAA